MFVVPVSVPIRPLNLIRRIAMKAQTTASMVPFVGGFAEKALKAPPSRLVYDESLERSDFSMTDTKNPLLMSPTHLGKDQDEAH